MESLELRQSGRLALVVCFALLSMLVIGQPMSQAVGAQSSKSIKAGEFKVLEKLHDYQISHRWDKTMGQADGLFLNTKSISIYHVHYASTDVKGAPRVLSGMVAIPDNGATKGLVLYFHGATSERRKVPSYYTPEAQAVVFAFATAGYAVAAPDYLGLGDSKASRPFALGSITAKSGIDLIRPARALGVQVNRPIGQKIFVTGYSEGGAAAMWTTRILELANNPELQVAGTAPICGPYDLSGSQAKFMMDKHSNFEYLAAATFFAAYTAYGMASSFGDVDLAKIFVKDFATYVPKVFQRELTDLKRAEALFFKGIQIGSFDSLNAILQPEFVSALLSRDRSNPFVKRLTDNDCFDWAPRSALWLYTIEDDFVVHRKNTQATIKAMRDRKVGPDLVRMYIHPGRKFTHVTTLNPALILVRKFFDYGFEAVPVTDEVTGRVVAPKIKP